MDHAKLKVAAVVAIGVVLIAAAIVLILPEGGRKPPPADWKRYEHEGKLFEVSLPPDWEVLEKPGPGTAVRFHPPDEAPPLGIQVGVEHVGYLAEGPLRNRVKKQLREQIEKNVQAKGAEVTSIPVRKLNLDGDVLVDVRYRVATAGPTLITRNVCLYKNDALYLLACTAREADAEERAKVYERILESFLCRGERASRPAGESRELPIQAVRKSLKKVEATLPRKWPFLFIAVGFTGSQGDEPSAMLITVNLVGWEATDLLADLSALQENDTATPGALKSAKEDVEKFVEFSLMFLRAGFDAVNSVEAEVAAVHLLFADEDGSRLGSIGLKRDMLQKMAADRISPDETMKALVVKVAGK